jgi:O-antigen/teichoic acid export membrane protein
LGLEAAGALRAMMNFILPMTQVTTAIATLALPALARASTGGDPHGLRRKAHLVTAVLTAIASVYGIVLCAAARPLEGALYNGKFSAYVWLLPILAFQPVLGAFAAGYSVVLRAVRKPRQCFMATAIAAPVGLLSSVLFMTWWGLAGLAVSMTGTCLVAAAAVFHFGTLALEEE